MPPTMAPRAPASGSPRPGAPPGGRKTLGLPDSKGRKKEEITKKVTRYEMTKIRIENQELLQYEYNSSRCNWTDWLRYSTWLNAKHVPSLSLRARHRSTAFIRSGPPTTGSLVDSWLFSCQLFNSISIHTRTNRKKLTLGGSRNIASVQYSSHPSIIISSVYSCLDFSTCVDHSASCLRGRVSYAIHVTSCVDPAHGVRILSRRVHKIHEASKGLLQ